jgi:hypothetical protein
MCTVSEATDTAATIASSPSQSDWLWAWENSQAEHDGESDAPVHGRNELAATAFLQVR